MALKIGLDPLPFRRDGDGGRVACSLEDAPKQNRFVIDTGARTFGKFRQPHKRKIGRKAYEVIIEIDTRTHAEHLLLIMNYQDSEKGRASCSNVQAERGCLWSCQ